MTARSPALSTAPALPVGAVVSSARRVFSAVLVAAILFLVFMGAQVKSHDAGLAVPDWPLAYGQWWPRMVGGVFHEHWHRAIATGVGLLTVVVALWTSARERRSWVRHLAWWLLFAVVIQGLLGGLTVKQLLPPQVSATHAGLAQTVLCLSAWLAYACSREWGRLASADAFGVSAGGRPFGAEADAPAVGSLAAAGARAARTRAARSAAVLAMGAVYIQLALGAWMRHTEAALAVPFFPVDPQGRLLPDVIDQGVAVHMAHRLFAVVVLGLVLRAALCASRAAPGLMLHAGALAGAVLIQAGLGAMVVWGSRPAAITSLHVANGALVLLLTWLLVLRLWRRAPGGRDAFDAAAVQARAAGGGLPAPEAGTDPAASSASGAG